MECLHRADHLVEIWNSTVLLVQLLLLLLLLSLTSIRTSGVALPVATTTSAAPAAITAFFSPMRRSPTWLIAASRDRQTAFLIQAFISGLSRIAQPLENPPDGCKDGGFVVGWDDVCAHNLGDDLRALDGILHDFDQGVIILGPEDGIKEEPRRFRLLLLVDNCAKRYD